ncbi:hypothetical protein N7456_002131 [Penicillium angulare]|uniref:Uncharacterized protein n=1 Tax=Penicillium angulare TaxID=116970 RepID=A0A9W9KPX6_9EURO|nr:hypothetical protein N7456_002131 [Penicillium angulare]
MKRFYHGTQYGISTDALSYTQIRLHPDKSSNTQRPFLFSLDAQICDEHLSLIIRTQQILFVPNHKRYLLYCNPDIARRKHKEDPVGLFICDHISDEKLANLVNPTIRAYRTGEEAASPTYTCGLCNTNFHIETLEHDTDLALVITKWIDLGSGMSPDDPKWARYSSHYRIMRHGEATIHTSDEQAGARICFENASNRSLECLRSCNLEYLKGERYKEIMYQALGSEVHFWHLAKGARQNRPV